MPLLVEPVRSEQSDALGNLLQLCLHELSEITLDTVNEDGRFDYPYFNSYFEEAGRHPYLIKVKRQMAGFALVREIPTHDDGVVFSMAEFFLLQRFRKLGIGEESARMIFDLHEGTWQVAVLKDHREAQAFWRKVVYRYTANEFRSVRAPDWEGPVFEFASPGPTSASEPVPAVEIAARLHAFDG